MKILFSLLAIVLLTKDCEQKKSSSNASTTTTTTNSDKIQDMEMFDAVSYETITRGRYQKIWVTKESITVTSDPEQVKKTTVPTSSKDWNELLLLLKDVDLKTLPELEAPTAMRLYDGAAIAMLAVIKDKVETTSSSFDDGHPPKAIEAVVNKVLSMNPATSKK